MAYCRQIALRALIALLMPSMTLLESSLCSFVRMLPFYIMIVLGNEFSIITHRKRAAVAEWTPGETLQGDASSFQ